MLEYYGDYAWNLSLSMALDMGANMDEVVRASRSIRDIGPAPGIDPARLFFHAWTDAGAMLEKAAREDEIA